MRTRTYSARGDKTSVLRWILGLAIALYQKIYLQILDRVKANLVYKVRKGFYSVASAKGQLIVFLVFYVFTQGQEGRARIKRILPEARRMPLYQLMNDPFGCLGLGRGEVETSQPIPLYKTSLRSQRKP